MYEPGGTIQANTAIELATALDELGSRMLKLREELGLASYQQYVSREIIPRIAELEAEFARLMRYPGLLDMVSAWRGKVDATLDRALAAWQRRLVLADAAGRPEILKLERELANRMVSHDYTLRGNVLTLGELREILRRDPDRGLRRDAWLAIAAPHAQMADDLIRLIGIRNDVARDLGYPGYVELTLGSAETSRAEVEQTLSGLIQKTDAGFSRLLEQSAGDCGIDQIRSWDISYLMESVAAIEPDLFPRARLQAAIDGWTRMHGISLAESGIALTFTDIPFNGLCMFIKPGDIRILANPSDGHGYYHTLFHELGHALHAAGIEGDDYAARLEAGLFAEAMAETFGYVTGDRSWLTWFGLDEAAAERIQASSIVPRMQGMRQRAMSALFEYRMYDDPRQDLDGLFGQMEADTLGCVRDDTPRWAANAWYASYPVYWQNYVLAAVLASQIHSAATRKFGGLHGSREAFEHVMAMYIKPGATVSWRDRLRLGTGNDMDPSFLALELTRGL